jgi:hypothetical protein
MEPRPASGDKAKRGEKTDDAFPSLAVESAALIRQRGCGFGARKAPSSNDSDRQSLWAWRRRAEMARCSATATEPAMPTDDPARDRPPAPINGPH